jgi:GTP-binding protein
VHLLDARHDPTDDDRGLLVFLAEIEIPTIIVLTKVDKLRPSERKKRIADISANMGLEEDQVIPFSAVTGDGRNELAEAINQLIEQPSWRQPG